MESPLYWILGLLFPMHVCAYPNGKVQSACSSMEPNHGVKAQTSPAPYNITVNQTVFKVGDKISVTIQSVAIPIEGFFLQARAASNGAKALGSFHTTDDTMQTLNCSTTANSAVSHTSEDEKSEVQVIWEAVGTVDVDIKMRATVVANKTVYWVNILGPKLTYESSVASRLMVPPLSTQIFCNFFIVAFILSK
ncbi:putative ferric-chelate reductase 1 [Ambystoma mexicanum]|uniref:putative ferric-chelate reductase 1 n=1 Tax=Ambystoma mexicanum TaxID=8296 RepID=UPI0037E853E8